MLSYLISLLLCFIAGMVGICKDYSKGKRTAGDMVVATVLCICLLGSLGYNYRQYREALYTQNQGTFNFPADNNAKPTFWKGMIANTLIFKNDEWLVAAEDKWEAWIENGKVNLNGTVRDCNGDLVFQINKTTWTNWSGKDFNYDERAIEVKDSKGNIIFQLEFNKEENKINVSGILYYAPDKLMLMGKEVTKSVIGKSPSSNAEISSFLKSMKPIFKYSRKDHPGERA